MKTKEAIKFIKDKRNSFLCSSYPEGFFSIIKLLKRGEKFEKMWKKLSETYGNYFSTFDVRIANNVEYKYLDELMDIIRAKILPKGEIK